MKITAYRSNKLQKIDIWETDRIDCVPGPDEIDDEEREALLDGSMEPMLCFTPKKNEIGEIQDDGTTCIGHAMCIPMQFVISIES